ncbi:MAG TPA: hypothetical protein VGG39_02700 [Polyangiaceae bacterium]|jgi:hypothetical protein
MTRPEGIGHVLGAREARTRRAVERWCEDHDARGCPIEHLAGKATELTERLGRDLTVHEVDLSCSSTVSAFVDEAEQRKAQESLAGAREEQRLRYLRDRARDYKLVGPEDLHPRPRRPRT